MILGGTTTGNNSFGQIINDRGGSGVTIVADAVALKGTERPLAYYLDALEDALRQGRSEA